MRLSAERAFADRLGVFFEDNGLPRMAGRVLGHLLTCDPPDQTFDQLVAKVAASRSTVSVVTRLLVRLGLVERFGTTGERKDRYRLRDGAWTSMLEQDLQAAVQLRRLAEEGMKTVGATSRLRAMREFFVFLETGYSPLLERWRRKR